MVFVTVGTHEQQFNRLVRAIDDLADAELADERIVIQTGYSDYEPANCEWAKFFDPVQMAELMHEADVVVTHGGPSSFVEAIAAGKKPVVVPRCSDYGEHVNDHQVEFLRFVAEQQVAVIPCYGIADLSHAISIARNESNEESFASNNEHFCSELLRIIEGL